MQDQHNNTLDTALHDLRASAGLTVRQLAERSGLAPSTVSRLETGHIDTPRPGHLQRLARALDADIEYLYALAGYLMPESLPEFAPYLRSKYGMPDKAIASLDEHFQALRDRQTETNAGEERPHDRSNEHP